MTQVEWAWYTGAQNTRISPTGEGVSPFPDPGIHQNTGTQNTRTSPAGGGVSLEGLVQPKHGRQNTKEIARIRFRIQGVPNPIFSNSGVFAEQDLPTTSSTSTFSTARRNRSTHTTGEWLASPARKEFSKTSAGEEPLSGMIEPVRRTLIFGSRLLIW